MKKNILFVWLPKTGGSTLNHMLSDLEGMNCILQDFGQFKNTGSVTFGHASVLELVRQGHISKKWYDEAFKVTFVRDPYTRIVSLWRYLMRIGHIQRIPFYVFVNKVVEGHQNIGAFNVKGLSQAAPQTEWMKGINFDFVGRYESYDEDVKKLMALFGHDAAPLPWINANPNRQEVYMNAYCPNSIAKVRAFYKEDFEQLKYEQ